MTINEIIKKLDGKIVNLTDGDAEVSGGYCGDFLSNVLCKANESCVWFTVMNNVNVAAVACLTGVGVVVLCEGISPDDNLMDKAKKEGVNIITTKHSVYDGCRLV